MYIDSFLTELSKKVDTVSAQLKAFESEMDSISQIKNLLTLKTLKDVDSLTGEDLVLLSKEEFLKVLETLKIDDVEEKMKIFFNASVQIKVKQRLISDGEIEISANVDSYIKWLNEQVKIIKEYIDDFNKNNKEYYNSLKISDTLYKKYINYFKNGKLVKPIYNIDEFNEVIKKSGIITSDKWQLLKYVGEKNLEFHKKNEANKKEIIEYTDEEIISFVENILNREKDLISNINEDLIKTSMEFLDYDEETIVKNNITDKDIVIYQKIPILDTLNNLYKETISMLKNEKDEYAFKIEKNLKNLNELVDSYNVIKKIES